MTFIRFKQCVCSCVLDTLKNVIFSMFRELKVIPSLSDTSCNSFFGEPYDIGLYFEIRAPLLDHMYTPLGCTITRASTVISCGDGCVGTFVGKNCLQSNHTRGTWTLQTKYYGSNAFAGDLKNTFVFADALRAAVGWSFLFVRTSYSTTNDYNVEPALPCKRKHNISFDKSKKNVNFAIRRFKKKC